jgi:alpha/beta superfamily hydrolase
MPLNYTLAQDFLDNQERFNLEGISRGFRKPVCVVQAGNDETVKFDEGKKLSRWYRADFHVIRDADHSFGGYHPYTENELPAASDKMVNLTAQFIVKQHESKAH